MRIAIDTNVLHLVMNDPSERGRALAAVLDGYNAEHDLMVCAPVYAELLAAPGAETTTLDAVLTDRGVPVDWVLSRDMWVAAGQAYGLYAQRRRVERPPAEPRRILADFIFGAHALHHADALLTFNAADFQTNFPTLHTIVPTI